MAGRLRLLSRLDGPERANFRIRKWPTIIPAGRFVVPDRRLFHLNSVEPFGGVSRHHAEMLVDVGYRVRREFMQKPVKVKEIFTSTATCLGRERYFQGSGLVDLMRAIQSV
jgi:hypothetical protein